MSENSVHVYSCGILYGILGFVYALALNDWLLVEKLILCWRAFSNST